MTIFLFILFIFLPFCVLTTFLIVTYSTISNMKLIEACKNNDLESIKKYIDIKRYRNKETDDIRMGFLELCLRICVKKQFTDAIFILLNYENKLVYEYFDYNFRSAFRDKCLEKMKEIQQSKNKEDLVEHLLDDEVVIRWFTEKRLRELEQSDPTFLKNS